MPEEACGRLSSGMLHSMAPHGLCDNLCQRDPEATGILRVLGSMQLDIQHMSLTLTSGTSPLFSPAGLDEPCLG